MKTIQFLGRARASFAIAALAAAAEPLGAPQTLNLGQPGGLSPSTPSL
jgi:hypothetical protein